MHAVAALVAAAAGAHILARLLRIPPIPLLLLAGVALSLLAPPDPHLAEDALVLGVSFLLFVVGLELDPRRIRAQKDASIRVGIAQFAVLAVLGFIAAVALGFGYIAAAYIALGLTASSTLVCVRLLQRRRQMFEPFGRLVLGVLLLQDALVLLFIPVVVELSVGWRAALGTLAGIILLGAAAILFRRYLAPLLLRFEAEGELILLSALALLFVLLAAADLLGLPLVVGAFLAGIALSRFPVDGIVRSELAPVGDFFAAIFFTALGSAIPVPTAVELGQAAVLTLVVLIVTPPLVTFLAERAGFSARNGIEAGLLLSNTSEISLVIVLTGMLEGHVGPDVFTVVAVVTLATMLITPLLATDRVTWQLVRWHPARRRFRAAPDPPSDHILLLGAGATGMPLLEDLMIGGPELAVVDEDPGVVHLLREAGIRTVRGDATDERVLRAAGADRARVVASTLRRPRDAEPVLRLAAGVPVLVRVFDTVDAAWVHRLGGTPVLYSEATADGLLRWFQDELGAAAAPAGEGPADAGSLTGND